jgi:hypothetical protein
MNFKIAIVCLGLFPSLTLAGLHSSLEPTNPLPAKWRGYLPDHRNLRMVAVDPATKPGLPVSPLREEYADLVLTLETAARTRRLTANEAADLSAAFVRMGTPDKAIAILRSARRQHPDDFRLAANLGTAYQLTGDLESAETMLAEAVTLAPQKFKRAEQFHLNLVRLRKKEGKAPADRWDDLFGLGVEYDSKKLPADAAIIVQQLALWLPADGRLLWQIAELANATGDVRTAANILDGCVAEFNMASPRLRERRTRYRAAADKLANTEQHTGQHPGQIGTLAFASSRPLGTTFDASKLPPIRADRPNPLPWPALQEVTVAKGFKPTFHKHIDALDGKPITLSGYPAPSGDGADGISFLMSEYPVGCWFCESPDATSLVRVELAGGEDPATVPRGTIKITGTLKLNRTDPEKFLYSIEKAKLAVAD